MTSAYIVQQWPRHHVLYSPAQFSIGLWLRLRTRHISIDIVAERRLFNCGHRHHKIQVSERTTLLEREILRSKQGRSPLAPSSDRSPGSIGGPIAGLIAGACDSSRSAVIVRSFLVFVSACLVSKPGVQKIGDHHFIELVAQPVAFHAVVLLSNVKVACLGEKAYLTSFWESSPETPRREPAQRRSSFA